MGCGCSKKNQADKHKVAANAAKKASTQAVVDQAIKSAQSNINISNYAREIKALQK